MGAWRCVVCRHCRTPDSLRLIKSAKTPGGAATTASCCTLRACNARQDSGWGGTRRMICASLPSDRAPRPCWRRPHRPVGRVLVVGRSFGRCSSVINSLRPCFVDCQGVDGQMVGRSVGWSGDRLSSVVHRRWSDGCKVNAIRRVVLAGGVMMYSMGRRGNRNRDDVLDRATDDGRPTDDRRPTDD